MTKAYVLRAPTAAAKWPEKALFLYSLRASGTRATYGPDVVQARKFTAAQRDKFRRDNRHIKGRFLTVDTAELFSQWDVK